MGVRESSSHQLSHRRRLAVHRLLPPPPPAAAAARPALNRLPTPARLRQLRLKG